MVKITHGASEETMVEHVGASPSPPCRIAITVVKSGVGAMLCPFFGWCDGVLVLDTEGGASEFYANPARTAGAICKLIVAARPDRLICGFIGEAEKRILRAAGIDVRLGSCACAVEEFVAAFDELAAA